MRKAFLISALVLGMTGCAAQSSSPAIRDLSLSRDRQGGESVTVASGDTLYGIAWRQNMDFRELARLNNISPPYRLQPGQTLRLDGNAPTSSAAQAPGADVTGTQASVVGATGAAAAADGETPDWLAPDTEAIERNRGVTGRSLESEPPSGEALSEAGQVGGSESPGPIYNYGSPGADGQLSARDRAEREALSQRRAEQNAADRELATPASGGNALSTTQEEERGTSPDTPASSSPESMQDGRRDAQVDAGTAVAGESDAPGPQQRTYEPVEDIPWQWPSDGQVVSNFSDSSNITAGIDIAGQKGQSVKAAGPGIVVYAGDGVRGYGNLILLKHNDQYLSAYAHNDSLRVKENDVVEAGEVIATMGNTDAESVKLHFEVRQDGQPQDPLKFLPQR